MAAQDYNNLTPKGPSHRSGRSVASFLLFGLVSGSATGALDVLLGCGVAGGSPVPRDSFEMLAVIAFWGLVLPGGLLGLVSYAAFRFLRGGSKISSLRARFTRPSVLAVLAAAVICGALAITYLGYARGIQVDAIDFRPLALCAFAVLASAAGGMFMSPRPALARRLAAFYLAASIGTASACIAFLGEHPGTLPFIETRTVALRLVIDGLRSFHDGDGDGFAASLCESDCDCDDANPRVHPSAVEVPDNGIDEDCNGKDLVRDEASDLQAKSANPPPGSTAQKKDIPRPAHVLLVTIDALRADHMRMYGYDRNTTPHLDGFAAKSALFMQSRSSGPSTRHSFPTLLTGRHFSSLKLKKGKKWSRLLPENVTFAEHLKEKGYLTRAVVPYFRFKERSGFSQGFDSWTTVVSSDRDPVWDPTADLVTDAGREHLDELSLSDGPWLLWLHYFDPHGAYVNHDDQKSFGTSRVDRYDGEILYTDSHIHRLFEHVRSLGLWDRVAIIVTSDHGEAHGREVDHGHAYHGFSLFDSEIRIPLIVRLPGAKPRVVERSVGLIDVPVTIMDLAGLAGHHEMQGTSLVPYLFGEDPPHQPIISELPGDRPQISLVDWPYKLIWDLKQNRTELYDLKKDPTEATDLAKQLPEITKRLADRTRLLRYDMRP